MGKALGSEQELSRRRNDSCSPRPYRRLGYKAFQASLIDTDDGRTRIMDPEGAGTGLVNRVKESDCISSQGLTLSGDGCNP